MNRKKRHASLLRISEVFSHLRFESQMTFRTAVQTDYIFIDQFACLSADQSPGSDSPEEIQHGSGSRTDGSAGNSQRTSRTGAANHADEMAVPATPNALPARAPRTMPTITVAPPAVIPVAVPTVQAR